MSPTEGRAARRRPAEELPHDLLAAGHAVDRVVEVAWLASMEVIAQRSDRAPMSSADASYAVYGAPRGE
jgi:hypothetical protein